MIEQLTLIRPVYELLFIRKGKGSVPHKMTEEFSSVWDALKQAISYMETTEHEVLGIKVDGEYVVNRPSLRSFWLLLGQCPDGYWITEEG